MAWNGAGVFNRLYSWAADKAAAINITASRMDADTNDIVTQGLGNCITRDGQGQPTANLPMATFRHTGVGDGASRTDYTALGQTQDGKLNWAVAGGGADTLTATYVPALTALVDGQLCFTRAVAANATTTPTFAPNGLTAHTITKVGGAALAVNDIQGTGHELILRYKLSTTNWELLNPSAPVVYSNDAGAAVGPSLDIFRDSASPAVSDFIGSVDFNGRDSGAAKQPYGQVVVQITDPTAASEDAILILRAVVAGTLTDMLKSSAAGITIPGTLGVTGATVLGATVSPSSNDGAALGDATHNFSDLFLASGGVVNFNNGDVTITHGSDLLSFAGATNGYTFDSGGFGYAAGAGSTGTQSTNKSTTVTMAQSCRCGEVTMNNAALNAANIITFAINSVICSTTDNVTINHVSGGTLGAYTVNAVGGGGGANTINVYVRNNTAGSLSEAIVLRFTVVKSANS